MPCQACVWQRKPACRFQHGGTDSSSIPYLKQYKEQDMKTKKHPFDPILLIDNDPDNSLWEIEKTLMSAGFNHIQACHKTGSVNRCLIENTINVVLIRIHDNTNMELFRYIIKEYPNVSVVAIIDRQDIPKGERCMKQGAFDYIIRPVEHNRIINVVRHAIESHELKQVNMDLQQKLLNLPVSNHHAFSDIVTQNRKMLAIINYIESISQSSRAVMFSGEPGSGKSALSHATHKISRPQYPIFAVDVSKMDGYEFCEVVFGLSRNPFEDNEPQKGLIDQANNGSLLIKNIDQMDVISQNKLFRLINSNEYIPLGSDKKYRSNVRVLATSKKNIKSLESSGRFRKDLAFYFKHHNIHVPPLRDHSDDMSLLVDHFIEKASEQYNKKAPRPPKELAILLETYQFPGNVSELQQLIFSAVKNHKTGILSMQMFKKKIAESMNHTAKTIFPDFDDEGNSMITFSKKLPTLKQASWLLTAEAMRRTKGNQSVAAHLLGISQQALSKRLQNMDTYIYKN
ncbi:MAG: response regulator HsfA [Candidatus Magnetoglobus multicellularis str. Araruama]|uniref:Response regulator HsfA n=1 Tax=Candidatus Magnetoglobus multicellularis str. Araruama TaxID=890399 RepID=A0A1V1NY12_9BACT|nr:MAG: response regulator HsfA [Candidatus Magnetoglobus multicellularis str. Araruama]